MSKKKIGRIFTSNPKFARKGLKTFMSVEEVTSDFGENSKEADFAKLYYAALGENDVKARELGFESWGYYGSDNAWRRYEGEMTKSGITVTDEEGVTTSYASTNEALATLGTHIIMSLKLAEDVVYISESTKNRTVQYTDLVNVIGESNIVETADDNHLYGFNVQEGQVCIFDLNGHKYGGDLHCFVNKGLCYLLDSVGTGCLFTTNFDPVLWYIVEDDTKVYDPSVYMIKEENGVRKIGWPHSSKWEVSSQTEEHTFYRETCEVVRNEGVCVIEGGWIGTYKPTFDKVINNTTWGNAIGCYGKSMLTINGGQFTTVSYSMNVDDVAAQIGEESWMVGYDWKAEATASGITNRYTLRSWQPYTAVIDSYEESQIIVNGGTFFGMYNDAFEISGELTTRDKHGVVIINDGHFVNGYLDWFFVPTKKYGSQSMLQASAPAWGTYPALLDYDKDGWMPIVVFGGRFDDNISTVMSNGGLARLAKEGDLRYGALRFTGMVSIRGGTYNFDFSDEFKDLEVEYTVREQVDEIDKSETPAEAVQRSIDTDADFKPFMFIDVIDQSYAKPIADIVKAKKYAFTFMDCAVSDEDYSEALTVLDGCSGVTVARRADGSFAELCKVTAPSPHVFDESSAGGEEVSG